MKLISNILLSPFALIYGLIIFIRNWLYNNNYFRSVNFDLPVINVGNLSTGGTGKTPHVEYLIRLLKEEYPLGVLSRGYRRTSSGYLDVTLNKTAKEVGDEPLLTKWKHPKISVAVSENRAMGIPSLVSGKPENFVVLLDDAFQHRSIRAGLNIILTPFHDLYIENTLLPIGNLREFKSGAKRADMIIVTHSPQKLSSKEKEVLIQKLNPEKYQHIFFSSLAYQKMYSVFQNTIEMQTLEADSAILLVTGIANNQQILNHLEAKYAKVYSRKFADHHHYNAGDIESIITTFNNIAEDKKFLITTEKDLTRLRPFAEKFNNAGIKVLCLPIKIIFATEEKMKFDKAIHFFIEKTLENYLTEENPD